MAAAEEGKRNLPKEPERSVSMSESESSAEGGCCNVYLVETAHVSQDSCRQVQAIIICLKPQAPTVTDMTDMWKKKKSMFGFCTVGFLRGMDDFSSLFDGSVSMLQT